MVTESCSINFMMYFMDPYFIAYMYVHVYACEKYSLVKHLPEIIFLSSSNSAFNVNKFQSIGCTLYNYIYMHIHVYIINPYHVGRGSQYFVCLCVFLFVCLTKMLIKIEVLVSQMKYRHLLGKTTRKRNDIVDLVKVVPATTQISVLKIKQLLDLPTMLVHVILFLVSVYSFCTVTRNKL